MKASLSLGVLLFFCCQWSETIAQAGILDSLRRALDTASQWSVVADLHYQIGFVLRKSNPDSTFAKADFLLENAKKRGDKRVLMLSYDLRAKAYMNKGQLETALQYFQMAYEIAVERGDRKKMANELQDMSYPLFNMSRFGEAAEKLFAALELQKALRDTNRMAALNNEIGRVLARQNRYEESIAYIRKGLQLNLAIGANPYYSYSRMGEAFAMAQKQDSALLYMQKAMDQAKKNGNAKAVALEKFNIAEIYLQKGKAEQAYPLLLEGLTHFENKKDVYFTPLYYSALAKTNNKQGRPAEALGWVDKGLAMVQETTSYEVVASLYEQRSYSHAALGDYRNALADALAWKTAADSVNTNQRMAQLSEVEARYQSRERQATIAQQGLTIARQRNRQQSILFIGLSLLLAAGAALLYLGHRSRLKNQQAEHALLLQQAESEKLRELDKLKSDFFANVSHELRTPLTLLLGPIDAVLKNKQLNNRDFTLLKLAQQNAGRLLRLIGEILDLTKLESGKLALNETPVALYPLLNRLVAQFDSHAQRLGIQLVFEYRATRNLHVLLDQKKFETLFNNLLSNALKFTPPHSGGMVRVSLEDCQENLKLVVCDTGRGIPPQDLERVFDRFYQSRRFDAPAEGGTGIGLAICSEYTRLFGGRIWAESPASPGNSYKNGASGSAFYVEFPKKEVFGDLESLEQEMIAESTPEERLAFIAALPTPDENPSILVVEDNEGLQQYLCAVFSTDYRVVFASNGAEALHLLESGASPDLILSDIMMPVMDGLQLLEKLKSDERFSAIPLVMLTARADMQDKLRALRIGVDDYLLKPFVEEELLARVQNLLQNARQRREATAGSNLSALNPQPLTIDSHHPPTIISAASQAWANELEQTVGAKLGDFNLTAEILADELAMSRAQFFRMVKQHTGLTPAQYLDEARFQQARRLLETGRVRSVKAAAYEVGFRDEKHFSKEFRYRYGKYPSAYLS